MWTNIWTHICSFMYLMSPGICNFVSFWWVSEEQYQAPPSSVSGDRVCRECWSTPASLLLPVALTAPRGVSPSLSLRPLITASGFLKKKKNTHEQTKTTTTSSFLSCLNALRCPGSWQWMEIVVRYHEGFIGGDHSTTDTLWFVSESSQDTVWTGVTLGRESLDSVPRV